MVMRVKALLGSIVVAIATAGGASAQAADAAPESIGANLPPATFSTLSKRVMPSVVNISTSKTIAEAGLPTFPDGSPLERYNEFLGRDDDGFRRQGALGSGFVISADGLIITNNHVIAGADEIMISFTDGKTLVAELIGTDANTDIAVLRVTFDQPLAFVELADSDTAEVGDWVMAIGNPLGFGSSVSVGIISARNRNINAGSYDDFIQTDAAINRGNSGGPLFDLNGDVVGVNTAIVSPSGGSIGIGFSIPANLVTHISGQLIEHGRARRSWLGVNIQPVDDGIASSYGLDEAQGVIITNIVEEGPAEAAGLEVGDLLLSFDGKAISDTRSLTRIVADAGIDKVVSVEIIRDRKRRTLNITLGELESDETEEDEIEIPDFALANNSLGVELGPITEIARRSHGISADIEGALVKAVNPRGPSFGKLEKGDVIVEMAFEPVTSLSAVLDALGGADTPLLVRVHREGRDAFLSIELDE